MVTNLCYADGIILLATSEAELQELVDRLDRVSRKYSLLVNVNKTMVMVSDGIACRIGLLIQVNNWSRWRDKFPYLWSMITEDEDGKFTTPTTEFCSSLNRNRGITAENIEVTAHRFQRTYD